MTRKPTSLFAAAAVIAGIATATAVSAEETPPPQSPPSLGMMDQHGGMMGMMGQMSPDQMQAMMRMADNCNRMMESMHTGRAGSGKDEAPAPHN